MWCLDSLLGTGQGTQVTGKKLICKGKSIQEKETLLLWLKSTDLLTGYGCQKKIL